MILIKSFITKILKWKKEKLLLGQSPLHFNQISSTLHSIFLGVKMSSKSCYLLNPNRLYKWSNKISKWGPLKFPKLKKYNSHHQRSSTLEERARAVWSWPQNLFVSKKKFLNRKELWFWYKRNFVSNGQVCFGSASIF